MSQINSKQLTYPLSGSFTGSLFGSASYSTTASFALNGGGTTINTSSFVTTSSFNTFTASYNTFSGSYNTGSFTGSFTGSLRGTSSYATTASYAMNGGGSGLVGGIDMYIPLWSGSDALTTSSLYQSGSDIHSLSNFLISGSNKLLFTYIDVNGDTGGNGLDYLSSRSRTSDSGIVSIYRANGNPGTIGYAFQFVASETTNNGLLFVGATSDQRHIISTTANSPGTGWPLIFRVAKDGEDWTTAENLLILTKDQNVGIGVTAPTHKLDVSGSVNITGSLTLNGVTGDLRPYKVYRVDMSQNNSSDPTINSTYENTIGNIVWTRNTNGIYNGQLIGAFVGKVVNSSRCFFGGQYYPHYYHISKVDNDNIQLTVTDQSFGRGDSLLANTFIEVLVYN